MKKNNIAKNTAAMCLIAITLFSATGCKKFLDTDLQGKYTTEDYPYPGGSGPYDLYLYAAYNDLRSYDIHCTGFFLSTSIRSDDADKGTITSDGGADANSMDLFPVAANNGFVNGMWVGYYGMITKCNTALDKVYNDKAIIATDAQKIQAEAEAKFLRAYCYFNLVRFFGKVPLIDKLLSVENINVPQSEVNDIYMLIEKDLQFAAANLPSSWDKKFIGRLTRGAANGLLAKVYLTQKKWAQAMASANTVMTSGQYDLSQSYANIFGESGENGKESVFEVQATSIAGAVVAEQNAVGAEFTQWQGVRADGIWNLGYGWNVPNTNLEAAYETKDPRKDRTFLYRSTANTTYRTVYGENTSTTWINPIYNHKVYSNPSFRSLYNSRSGRWMNIRILRYADVVLMYAEAANELGGATNITAARNALNTVRARARAGDNSILADRTTNNQDELREFIRHERRIELAMEHDRFFDLVRWGISGSVLPSAGRPNFIATRDNLLPIPQTQIDLSKNLLKQNPGYPQ